MARACRSRSSTKVRASTPRCATRCSNRSDRVARARASGSRSAERSSKHTEVRSMPMSTVQTEGGSSSPFPPPRADARILVVEDDEALTSAMVTALSARGYRVFAADNGADAMDLCNEEMPDVVLLDLGLPDVD